MDLKRSITTLIQPAAIQALLLKERWKTGAAFNPLSPALRRDPYRIYRHLHEKDPVHRSELLKGLVLTRHADVSMVLRDARFRVSNDNLEQDPFAAQRQSSPYAKWFQKSLLELDPPVHTRLRSLVSRAFTPRAIEAMRPRIAAIVDELLDAVAQRGHMDLITDLAYPLPVTVIAEMLGVPAEDRDHFKRWSDDLGAALDPILTPEVLKRADRSTLELQEYLAGIVAARRRQPREDLISALIAVQEQGDTLSDEELYATCMLLLAAGNETTTNLIGNGMLALLRNPDQLQRLREDPCLIEPAVEELLRYDSPVQMTGRIATEALEIGGKPVKKGEFVITLLGAANRDPEQFPNPDRLDIARTPNRHVSFGMGIHFCLGAPLARVEGAIAINALVSRLPGMRLTQSNPAWRKTILLRGLTSLPVTFEPATVREASAAR
jgi:pimeloyl-[acyl-carrier protein] synthase